MEPLPPFPKALELHKPSEEPFDVKDIFNASLESEALKETLFRQAKTQVRHVTSPHMTGDGQEGGGMKEEHREREREREREFFLQ